MVGLILLFDNAIQIKSVNDRFVVFLFRVFQMMMQFGNGIGWIQRFTHHVVHHHGLMFLHQDIVHVFPVIIHLVNPIEIHHLQ